MNFLTSSCSTLQYWESCSQATSPHWEQPRVRKAQSAEIPRVANMAQNQESWGPGLSKFFLKETKALASVCGCYFRRQEEMKHLLIRIKVRLFSAFQHIHLKLVQSQGCPALSLQHSTAELGFSDSIHLPVHCLSFKNF